MNLESMGEQLYPRKPDSLHTFNYRPIKGWNAELAGVRRLIIQLRIQALVERKFKYLHKLLFPLFVVFGYRK